ncbi:MAG: hypothetical protein R2763_17330 [Mycobacterium sp.]
MTPTASHAPGDDGLLEFRWGGRRLALVAAADLTGGARWPPGSWPTICPTPCPAVDRPVSTPAGR